MSSPWERWLPIGGIVFVALVVVAILFGLDDPGGSNRETLGYYEDGGNRTRQLAGLVLVGLGALSFLVFLVSLPSGLRRTDGEADLLTAFTFAAGASFVAPLLAANALFVGLAERTGEDDFQLAPTPTRLTENVGYTLFVSALAVAGLLIAVTSTLALQGQIFPRWPGWLGLVIALALVASGFAFVPLFALLAWVLVVSVLLLGPADTHPQPAPV